MRVGVLREAYEWFTMAGELPTDDDSIAYAVVMRALNGGEEVVRSDAQLQPSKRPSPGLSTTDSQRAGVAGATASPSVRLDHPVPRAHVSDTLAASGLHAPACRGHT